jgi:hypothetical protein
VSDEVTFLVLQERGKKKPSRIFAFTANLVLYRLSLMFEMKELLKKKKEKPQ